MQVKINGFPKAHRIGMMEDLHISNPRGNQHHHDHANQRP
jgi:hypothetical protein